jgi:hypothetical protein
VIRFGSGRLLFLGGGLPRVIGNDWVVRHDNRYFQVKAQAWQYAPAKGKVTMCEWEDGRLQIRYRSRAVVWEEIPALFQFRQADQDRYC